MRKSNLSAALWSAGPVLVVAAGVGLCYVGLMPASLRHIEAEGFWAATPDFLRDMARQPAGATRGLSALAETVFRSPGMGAAVLALLPLAAAMATTGWLRRFCGHIERTLYTLFIYIGLTVCLPLNLFGLMAVAMAMGLTALHASLRRPGARRAVALCLPLAYVVVPEPLLLLAGVQMTAAELWSFADRRGAYCTAGGLVLALLVPPLWSAQVAYLPPATYYGWEDGSAGLSTALLCVVGLPVLVAAIKGMWRRAPQRATRMASLSVLLPVLVWLGTDKTVYKELWAAERVHGMEQAAEAADWETVLRKARTDGQIKDIIGLRYALLAEAERGTLIDHLLLYPVTAPDQLLFRNAFSSPVCLFNGFFYRGLGYPDEAFHQFFEYGTLAASGCSRRALRLLTDTALDGGDVALARTYLNVLERALTPADWLAERRRRIAALEAQDPVAGAPLRARNYVGSIELANEWVYALEQDSTNKRLTDYLLCAFLLKKQPEKVARLVELSSFYEGCPLPAPVAQAMALFADGRPQWQGRFCLSEATVQEWRACLRLQQEGRMDELARRSAGTYWYYLFFTNTPPHAAARP